MLALLLLIQADPGTTVVTARHLLEQEAVCRAGDCTPLRDAQVSIAIAESRFRGGDYLGAKRVLAAALARNRAQASVAPKPVAALYEAYATVTLHEGDQDSYRRAVAGRVRTLRQNLPGNDPAVVNAAPALGDMWLKLRRYREADFAYRSAERDAGNAGNDRAAMLAGMKRAALASAMGRTATARSMIADLAARPAAGDPVMADVLNVVRFRIAMRDGDDATVTRLARSLKLLHLASPPLLWEPPYPRDPVTVGNSEARKFEWSDRFPTRSTDLDGVQWIDAGFWIRPDGRTDEAEILRGSGSGGWAAAFIRQIEGRRYAAPAVDGTSAVSSGGVYRVERVTRRSEYVTPPGSLIARRIASDGFETLDLMETAAKSR